MVKEHTYKTTLIDANTFCHDLYVWHVKQHKRKHVLKRCRILTADPLQYGAVQLWPCATDDEQLVHAVVEGLQLQHRFYLLLHEDLGRDSLPHALGGHKATRGHGPSRMDQKEKRAMYLMKWLRSKGGQTIDHTKCYAYMLVMKQMTNVGHEVNDQLI